MRIVFFFLGFICLSASLPPSGLRFKGTATYEPNQFGTFDGRPQAGGKACRAVGFSCDSTVQCCAGTCNGLGMCEGSTPVHPQVAPEDRIDDHDRPWEAQSKKASKADGAAAGMGARFKQTYLDHATKDGDGDKGGKYGHK